MIELSFICGILLLSQSIFAHRDPAYSHDDEDQFESYKNWMQSIRDDVSLSELAIPGTHDSGTFRISENADISKTQSRDFNQQLEYGIRVFDIRIRHTSDRFAIHHGDQYANIMFDNFLDALNVFLTENPSECILFRLREEKSPNDNNSRSIRETLDWYLNGISDKYMKTTTNMKLGDVRGKFIILNDNLHQHIGSEYGIEYHSFDIQDEYHLNTNWDLYAKWKHVKGHLATAADGDKEKFYMNYLSGSGGAFPYFVASGHMSPGSGASRLSTGLTTIVAPNKYPDFPRTACLGKLCTISFEGTNILTRDRIPNFDDSPRTVGIIMSDFPGTSLIQTVIDNNSRLRA